MKRSKNRLALAAGLLVFVAACVGPVIILPPPDAPDGVDTTAEGLAVYCGVIRDVEARDAHVVLINIDDPAQPAVIENTDGCGCYENVAIPAAPTDRIRLRYLRAGDDSVSQSVEFLADLSDQPPPVPTTCTPCANVTCP